MSFNPSIPNPTDFLAVSQKQLLANFQQIYNSFAQNHNMLSSSIQGQHTSLTMRVQNTDPTTAADQTALYCKLDANNLPQMFFRPQSNQTPIQMTNSSIQNISGGNQVSYVAGPFTIYIGYLLDVTTPFPVTLTPAKNLLYAGVTALGQGSSNVIATSLGVGTFTVSYAASAIAKTSVYYFAIGAS